ncbi:MAG: hypothetical protein LUQ55_01975 [Methanomassiliicoccales archaeon]|nr:hypothetical protein [Methanomassiliicoccales archaeon]
MKDDVRALIALATRHRVQMVLFALLSLPPFLWLGGYPLGWGDTGLTNFFYNSDHLSGVYSYQWTGSDLMGGPYGWATTLLPMTGVSSFMSFLGMSYYLQQALVFALILFTSMISMYFFVLLFLEGGTHGRLMATAAALFYAYNPMSMIVYWYPGLLNLYLLPFIPLVSLLLVWALRNPSFKSIVLLAVVISIFSIVFVNPTFLAAPVAIFASLFVYETVKNRRKEGGLKKMARTGSLILILSFLMMAWFALPILASSGDYFEASTTAMDPKATLVEMSRSVSPQSLLRFMPLDTDSPIWAYKDPDWRYFYDSPLFVAIGILALLVVLFPLISRRRNWSAAFFSVLLIVGITLCLGLNSPFGGAYEYLFDNVPFFQAFRIPYSKFMPLILFPSAILFGMGVSRLEEIPKWFGRIGFARGRTLVILFLVVGVYALPMWTGSALNSPITIRGNEISSSVVVPQYYGQMAEFLQGDTSSYRIVALPLRPYNFVGFDWERGYDGPDYTWLMLEHDTISNLGNDPTPSSAVASELLDNVGENLIHLSRLTASKYVLVQNDVDTVRGNYGGTTLVNQTKIISALKELNATKLVSFGQLDLYQIPDLPTPRLYGDVNPVLVSGGVEEMYSVLGSGEYQAHEYGLFLTNDLTEKQQTLVLGANGSVTVDMDMMTSNTKDGWEDPFDWIELNAGSFQSTYYEGWKSVVRTDGQETNSTLSFSNPLGDVIGVWWETDWMGMGTKPIEFPVEIPPNQRAIIQIPVDLSPTVTVDAEVNASVTRFNVQVQDGFVSEFAWSQLDNGSIESRYFEGWKDVIRTDGVEANDSLVFSSPEACPYVFPPSSPDAWNSYNSTLIYIRTGPEPLIINSLYASENGPCPYEFPPASASGWSGYSSTLVFVRAGAEPFRIDSVLVDGRPAEDIVGVWWTSGWMGMGTEDIEFPVIIPSGEKAIIQIAKYCRNVTLSALDLTTLRDSTQTDDSPEIVFQKKSAVKYEVQVNASSPFFLVLSEAFHPQWKVFAKDGPLDLEGPATSYTNEKVMEMGSESELSVGDVSLLVSNPLDEQYHIMVNGYANSWLIDPALFDLDGDGEFSLTIYYAKQSYFYAGAIISGATVVGCAIFVVIGYATMRSRRER